MNGLLRRSLTVGLVIAAMLAASSWAAQPQPAFSFGRKGGTILPFNVKIFPDGRVVVTGSVRTIEHVTVTPQALAALRKLAQAERFFSMPRSRACQGSVVGLATNYIRVRIAKRDKTVDVTGGCNKRFLELFEILKAVAAVSTTPKSP